MHLDPSKTYGSWNGAEITTFLQESRIPLRVSFMTKNGLLIVPIWFEYVAGQFIGCSPASSLLVTSLKQNPEVAFDLSTNDLPYRGLRGRALAHCSVAPNSTALEQLLVRYTGNTDNALAHALLSREQEEAIIEFQITWLTSWDFSKRMDGLEKITSRLPDISV